MIDDEDEDEDTTQLVLMVIVELGVGNKQSTLLSSTIALCPLLDFQFAFPVFRISLLLLL